MNESIKQAMHLDACKSFGAAEANENERRWDDKMIDSKNNDSINNYDKTRMRLNFEIAPMVRFTLWAIRIKDLMFACKNG